MELMERLGTTISIKGQCAVDKVKNLAAIANTKSQIAACEEVIRKNYQQIGKQYYEEHSGEEAEAYEKQMKAIENAKKGIEELSIKLADLKSTIE